MLGFGTYFIVITVMTNLFVLEKRETLLSGYIFLKEIIKFHLVLLLAS